MIAQEIRAGSEAFVNAALWAERHFERALLYLADVSGPLARRARFFSVMRGPNRAHVAGVAVYFDGFGAPTFSCAAQDVEACGALLEAAPQSADWTLITHEAQQLPAAVAALTASHDTWLARTSVAREHPPDVCPVTDARELFAFYAQHGVPHVHADMHALGHVHGIRDDAGQLVCVGGLHFAIADRYAQLGGLFTAEHARGRGCASRVLEAINGSLAAAGVERCGLFADAADPSLPGFYAARGYRVQGRFAFRRWRS